MSTITPPEAPQSPTPRPAAPSPVAPAPTAPGSLVVSIIAIVLGAVIALGTITGAVVTSLAAANTQTITRDVPVDGLESLAVDIAAGSFHLEYGDVDSAQLEVTGGWNVDRWRFDRDGGALVIATPDRFSVFGWAFGGPSTATLTLPREFADTRLDAAFSLSAGDLNASGTYDLLEVDMSAGSIDVSGTARNVSAELSAGHADLDIADATTADFSVSAGQIVSRLTGSAPREVTVSVSAGSLELTVPDQTYDVNVDVSAGDLDNRLQTSSSASRTITGDISAGDITLRPAE